MGEQLDEQVVNVIAGGIAFVLTATNIILGFPLLTKVVVQGARSMAVLVFFLTGFLMQGSWLVCLWPLCNYFIRIGFGLSALCSLVFFCYTTWVLFRARWRQHLR